MTRLLVVMGSGETTPTMVTTHQRVFGALGPDPTGVVLDTPYGFQMNADEVTAKARRYFSANVGVHVDVASMRRADTLTPVATENLLAVMRESAWVFAGPGSPSYLVREWQRTAVPDALRSRLHSDAGATVFASAAAVTLGVRAVPVYEIYKAGVEPSWIDGLDLLAGIGLDAVCIPHFDNADGGTRFDTRFCYLGESRLAAMERQLPDGTWILGVDEHTALVADLVTGAIRVEGRGRVTVRARDVSAVFPAGSRLSLDDLVAAARGTTPPAADGTPVVTASSASANAPLTSPARADATADPPRAAATTADAPPPPAPGSLLEEVTMSRRAFDSAMADADALAAAEAALALEEAVRAWADDVEEADHADRARAELRRQVAALARVAQAGLHEHRDLVAPHVETLLDLRDSARAERRFGDADAIRAALAGAGVEVRDTPEGPGWKFHDPLEEVTPS